MYLNNQPNKHAIAHPLYKQMLMMALTDMAVLIRRPAGELISPALRSVYISASGIRFVNLLSLHSGAALFRTITKRACSGAAPNDIATFIPRTAAKKIEQFLAAGHKETRRYKFLYQP